MRQCHCFHKAMGVGIHYLVVHFCVCKKVLSGTISDVQCSSSSGTVGKSSSLSGLSEYPEVLSRSWSSSELNDRQWHTGLVGVCCELQGVTVTVL